MRTYFDTSVLVAACVGQRFARQRVVGEKPEEPARTVDHDRTELARLHRVSEWIEDLNLGPVERDALGLDHLLPRLRKAVRDVSGDLGEPVVGQGRPAENRVHLDPAVRG